MFKIKYKYYFIYKTTCLITNMIYVGQKCVNNLNDGYIGCGIRYMKDASVIGSYFHNAVKKYGYENFQREIIEFVETVKDLDLREIFWIKELHAHYTEGGYNMTWGGDHRLEHHSKKTCEKMSRTRKGRVPWNKGLTKETDERLRKMGEKRVGKTFTNDYIRKKKHESMLGKNTGRHSVERCRINSKSHMGIKQRQESKEKISNTLRNKPLQTCIYCGYQSRNGGTMKKYHGDNCKQNPNYIDKREIQTCEFCGFQSRAKNVIVQHHGTNCKYNTNKSIVNTQTKTG